MPDLAALWKTCVTLLAILAWGALVLCVSVWFLLGPLCALVVIVAAAMLYAAYRDA